MNRLTLERPRVSWTSRESDDTIFPMNSEAYKVMELASRIMDETLNENYHVPTGIDGLEYVGRYDADPVYWWTDQYGRKWWVDTNKDGTYQFKRMIHIGCNTPWHTAENWEELLRILPIYGMLED